MTLTRVLAALAGAVALISLAFPFMRWQGSDRPADMDLEPTRVVAVVVLAAACAAVAAMAGVRRWWAHVVAFAVSVMLTVMAVLLTASAASSHMCWDGWDEVRNRPVGGCLSGEAAWGSWLIWPAAALALAAAITGALASLASSNAAAAEDSQGGQRQ